MRLGVPWFAWIHSGAPSGRRIHSGPLRFVLGVAVSRGFTLLRIGFTGLIRARVVRSSAPSGSRVHSGSLGFIRAGLVGVGIIRVGVG